MIYIVIVRDGDYSDNDIDDIADYISGVYPDEAGVINYLNTQHTIVEIDDDYDKKGRRFGKVNYLKECSIDGDYVDFVILRKDI